MGQIEENIAAITEQIRAAARRSGRDEDSVRLMVVTKTQPRELVEEAYAAGARLFGENRVTEAEQKFAGFPSDTELHMIGHLQRNKAAKAAPVVRCVQSIDKVETAAVLDRHCASLGRIMDIMLEVNTSGEESKEGFRSENALFRAFEEIRSMQHLRTTGLMTMAVFSDDAAAIRRCFRKLATLRDELRRRFEVPSIIELSMGMTNDFEIAVEEGSTLVRVGTAIFGPRTRR